MGLVGCAIVDIGKTRAHASPCNCRKTLTWISPETIGTVINLTASAILHVHQVTEMTDKDRQTMDQLDITSKSETVYYYKTFRYQRLADAVSYAKIDAARQFGSEQGQSHE